LSSPVVDVGALEALDRVRARNAVTEPLEEDPDVPVQAQWLAPSGADCDG